MSLNWDVTKVKDFEAKFPDIVDGENRQWNGKFMCLMYYNMFTDMGAITEKNASEFYTRIKIYDKLFGCLSNVKGVPHPLTYQDVKDVIGMSINVSPEKRPYFIKKVMKRFQEEIDREIQAVLDE